jgi:hypothetical protein
LVGFAFGFLDSIAVISLQKWNTEGVELAALADLDSTKFPEYISLKEILNEREETD